MKRFSRMLAGLAAVAGGVTPCAAQVPASSSNGMTIVPIAIWSRPCCPRPSVPGLGAPAEPTTSTMPSPTTPETPAPSDNLPETGRYKSTYGQGTAVSGGAGIGAAVAAAAAGLPVPANNARVAVVTSSSGPLIMPGLFTAASVQSVIPMDRVSFDYGYFNRFAIATPNGAAPGFNLNQMYFSAEKTLLDGKASLYVSVPYLWATNNVSGQQIDGLGDVFAGFKYVLYRNAENNNTLTGGLTVAAPTAHSATVTTTTQLNLTFTGPTIPGLPAGSLLGPFRSTTTQSINPTYIQPWIGGLYTIDRFFVQEYFGVILPTDSRVSNIINNSVTFGYNLYRNQGGIISALTPIAGVQMLLPMNHIGNSVGATTSTTAVNIPCTTTTFPAGQLAAPQNVTFPDQVFLSGGLQMGLGSRALFSASVITPVAGPRGYSVGATFGLTYFY